tara:strand:- start:711 stop:902 length:192 start_codon:yes stop_codon:yes gene_type:complete
VSQRTSFLLRTDPEIMEAMKRWARDELRSVNGQIEFLLRRALQDAGRLKAGGPTETGDHAKAP